MMCWIDRRENELKNEVAALQRTSQQDNTLLRELLHKQPSTVERMSANRLKHISEWATRLGHTVSEATMAKISLNIAQETLRDFRRDKDTIFADNLDIDGRCRFVEHGQCCMRPTVEGTCWCADHIDRWCWCSKHATWMVLDDMGLYTPVCDGCKPVTLEYLEPD